MARYRQIPELVDAEQFVGGVDSANKVHLWLEKHGCQKITWVDNQSVMDIHLQERLSFFIELEDHKMVYSAYRGDWIVKKGDRYRIFTDKKFKERFEQV